MGLNIITMTATGYTAHVRCDCCIAAAPEVEHAVRSKALQVAERAAEDQGYVHYPASRRWVCPACRIKQLPDHLKAYLPNLCAQYGVTVPETAPAEPAPRKTRRKKSEI